MQRGFPVAIALRLRNDQRKTSEQWGINKEAGKRSEVPFSRREEGRELGEEKGEREKRIERKVKEKEGAALANLFVMSFSLLVRVVKMG